MKRIEVNVLTGEQKIVDLTAEEVAQAQAINAAWQIEEAIRLEEVAKEKARQVKFEEWLETQG